MELELRGTFIFVSSWNRACTMCFKWDGRLSRHKVSTLQKEPQDVNHNVSLPVMQGMRADMIDHKGLHSVLQNFFQPCSFWIITVVVV